MQCLILGQSGKIRLVYIGNNTEDNFRDENKNLLTFQVDNIAEIDGQGGEVGKTGTKKDVLNSLASQQFTFSKVDNVSYYQGIDVITSVNLSAFLSGPHGPPLTSWCYCFFKRGMSPLVMNRLQCSREPS